MTMSDNILLLSIRPQYAEKIFGGTKTVELRRVRPRVEEGDRVLVYVSSPVKALVGVFRVNQVVERSPQELWGVVRREAGIEREAFEAYYDGASAGFGIFFSDVWQFSRPIELQSIRQQWSGFQPPQGYRYLKEGQADADLLLSLVEAQLVRY